MTAGDTGLQGSPNGLDSSVRPIVPQDNRDAMSATTTVYATPYYPPTAAYPQSSSNPSHIYRRPSQQGLPGYNGQFQTAPPPPPLSLSDPQAASDSISRNNTATPLPPSSSMQQYPVEMSQPIPLRTNPSTPVAHTISEPHPRIGSFSSSTSPIDPSIQLDIVHHPVSEIVAMLSSKLQKLITTSD